MNILFYSTKTFEKPWLVKANRKLHEMEFETKALTLDTAHMAAGYQAVSVFTGDDVSAEVLEILQNCGIEYIAVRAAGYDNVNLEAADYYGIKVANVPDYSPYAIAEHAVTLMLCLNRKIVKANYQVRKHNFSLDNLVGFDLNNKTVGIIGTGKIGGILAKIMHGFGCNIMAYDKFENEELVKKYNVQYVELDVLCLRSDIISIHTPLNSETKNLVNKNNIHKMKKGVMIINTGRGGVVNTTDVLSGLESGRIGAYGMDVYEKERGVFFYNLSRSELKDDMLKRLINMPNVIVTPHMAFATKEALCNIADTTLYNLDTWADGEKPDNELKAAKNIVGTSATVK